ncbi:MAG TPA: hypothetical protein VMW02_02635 [Thermoplasmata archaeon]|nr:hypothetical protein [Thermoplasmata archaeon]
MNYGSVERIKKAIDGINPEEKLILIEYIANSIRKGKVKGASKYSFSDLAGKLTWSGDAVEEQRKLRNEW